MHRYFVFIWEPADADSAKRVASIQSSLLDTPPWVLSYQDAGVCVMHQAQRQPFHLVHYLASNRGIVLGTLFHRAQGDTLHQTVTHFGDSEARRIVETSGRHLVEHYWGTYVAVLHDAMSGACSLIRDPTANLACYKTQSGNIHIFFADMEDLSRHVHVPLTINWQHVAGRLLAGSTHSRDCGLNEIEDVPGGERVSLANGEESRQTLWHPAKFCIEDGLENEQKAIETLRSTVLGVTQTLASEHKSILVLLSGGLDSSIVASSLARLDNGINVTCLNFFIRGDSSLQGASSVFPGLSAENLAKVRRVIGSADEREFARKVADRCHFKLVEKQRPISDLDFELLYSAPQAPRPTGYCYILDVDDGECECATEAHATACFTGQGGDSVFCATQRVLGALDYAYLHPFGSHLLREILSAVTLSREHFARVVTKVIKYGYFRIPLPPPFVPTDRPHLLNDNIAADLLKRHFRHPWIDAIPRLSPGKHSHVLGVTTSVPSYDNTYRRERIAPSIHPLASQPVVETCLRIPTYVLLMDGITRGLARRTFKDQLPIEVCRRTVKGSGIAFYRNIVKHNLASIRDHLLNGSLVREGLLDRSKLETYLTDEQPFLTVQPEQIMDYIACDTWVTQLIATR